MALKYKNEIIIDAPREKVVNLFTDPEKIDKWQPGFISMEHISGVKGEVNSKYLMHFKMGKRKIDMLETITKVDLPNEFAGTYEAKGVFNLVTNNFQELPNGQTKYVAENEFKFTGFMKVMGFLFPGMFKKQSQKYLDLFKVFVENEEDKQA